MPDSNHYSVGPGGPEEHQPGGGRGGHRMPEKRVPALYFELNYMTGTMHRWCSLMQM